MAMEFQTGGGHLDRTLIKDGDDLLFPMLVRLTPEGEFTYDAQATYEYLRENFFEDLPPFQRSDPKEEWRDPSAEELENKGAIGIEGSSFNMAVGAVNLWGVRWTKSKLMGLVGVLGLSFVISLAALLISVF